MADFLDRLPKEPFVGRYDTLALAVPHYERLREAWDGPNPHQREGYTYAGLRVVAHPAIPDGFAVAKNGDEVVGVIDFKKGCATFMRPKGATRWFG